MKLDSGEWWSLTAPNHPTPDCVSPTRTTGSQWWSLSLQHHRPPAVASCWTSHRASHCSCSANGRPCSDLLCIHPWQRKPSISPMATGSDTRCYCDTNPQLQPSLATPTSKKPSTVPEARTANSRPPASLTTSTSITVAMR